MQAITLNAVLPPPGLFNIYKRLYKRTEEVTWHTAATTQPDWPQANLLEVTGHWTVLQSLLWILIYHSLSVYGWKGIFLNTREAQSYIYATKVNCNSGFAIALFVGRSSLMLYFIFTKYFFLLIWSKFLCVTSINT